MNRNSLFRLLSVAFIAAQSFTAAHAADAPQYAVSIPGITSVVMVRIPPAFRPAATAAEASARKTLIDALQTNPLGKATISEAFSTDWTRPTTLPILYLGTLPSAEHAQGKFTSDYWKKLKEMFTQQAKMSVITLRQQMLTYGLPDPGDTMSRTIAAADNNTVVLFGFAPTGKASDAPPLLVARKLKYIRKSIVLFEAGVDASAPGAMATLDYIIRTVDAP